MELLGVVLLQMQMKKSPVNFYEEPFDEDTLFTDLREDEYPEFLAVDNYPSCIYQMKKDDWARFQKWEWYRKYGLGTLIG